MKKTINDKNIKKIRNELNPKINPFNNNKDKIINSLNKNKLRYNSNYTLNPDISRHRKKRKKTFLIGESSNNLTDSTTFDIGNNLSNMKRQLNNVSVNRKNILKIQKRSKDSSKNMYILSTIRKNRKINKAGEWNDKLLRKKQISFSILRSNFDKLDLVSKNKELEIENTLLKENNKFLLSQIKKFQKNIFNNNNPNEIMSPEKASQRGTENSENKNKVKSVFDILDKYKKEIGFLKHKMKNLFEENIQLKEHISTKKKNNNFNINDINDNIYYVESKENFENSLKNKLSNRNPMITYNTLDTKKIHRNKRNYENEVESSLPYKKKSLNNYRNISPRDESYNSNILENFDYNNTFQNSKNERNSYFSYFSEKDYNKYNNLLSSFNTKGANLILIDNDFRPEDNNINHTNSINNEIRYFNLKQNPYHNYFKIKGNKIAYNYENVKTPSSLRSEIYYKNQLNSLKRKKVPNIENILNEKKLSNEN